MNEFIATYDAQQESLPPHHRDNPEIRAAKIRQEFVDKTGGKRRGRTFATGSTSSFYKKGPSGYLDTGSVSYSSSQGCMSTGRSAAANIDDEALAARVESEVATRVAAMQRELEAQMEARMEARLQQQWEQLMTQQQMGQGRQGRQRQEVEMSFSSQGSHVNMNMGASASFQQQRRQSNLHRPQAHYAGPQVYDDAGTSHAGQGGYMPDMGNINNTQRNFDLNHELQVDPGFNIEDYDLGDDGFDWTTLANEPVFLQTQNPTPRAPGGRGQPNVVAPTAGFQNYAGGYASQPLQPRPRQPRQQLPPVIINEGGRGRTPRGRGRGRSSSNDRGKGKNIATYEAHTQNSDSE